MTLFIYLFIYWVVCVQEGITTNHVFFLKIKEKFFFGRNTIYLPHCYAFLCSVLKRYKLLTEQIPRFPYWIISFPWPLTCSLCVSDMLPGCHVAMLPCCQVKGWLKVRLPAGGWGVVGWGEGGGGGGGLRACVRACVRVRGRVGVGVTVYNGIRKDAAKVKIANKSFKECKKRNFMEYLST